MGATLAVKTAIRIATESEGEKTQFRIQGDSTFVIAGIKSGRLFNFNAGSRLPNAHLWRTLAEVTHEATEGGLHITWIWAPRRYNRIADELLNARVDGRDPNPLILATPIPPPQLEEELDAILTLLTRARKSMVRTLPIELAVLWREVVYSKCGDQRLPQAVRRKLFWVFPALLSAHHSRIQGRHDYKHVRDHLNLLMEEDYFMETLSNVRQHLTYLSSPENRRNRATDRLPPDLTKRAETLASRGLFDRIIVDKSVEILDASKLQAPVAELFPQSPLPARLPECEVPGFELSELTEQVRRIKRGASPGLSGWTRELLLPLTIPSPSSPVLPFNEFFKHMCNDIAAVSPLSVSECGLITTGVLILFGYKDNPHKIRPIIVKETILKIVLKALLRRIPPGFCRGPGSTFGQPGGATSGIVAIQACLDRGNIVVQLDAKNAFNVLRRQPVFDYLRSHERQFGLMFPLLNLVYASTNVAVAFGQFGECVLVQKITTGTSQGCVTGPQFLEWGKNFPARTSETRRHINSVGYG